MKISVLWIILILWPDFISSEVFVIGPRSIRFQENLKLHVINTEQSDEAISITLVGKNKGDTLYADDVEKLDFDQVQTEISVRSRVCMRLHFKFSNLFSWLNTPILKISH